MNQRQQFVQTVSRLLDEDERVVLLLGDITTFAFRDAAAKHPDRVLNMGTCEQGMCGFAAGLALEGMYPVTHSIEPFIVRRAYEQIRLDFGEMKLPGLFITVGADMDYPTMGPSHWCPEGADMMRAVPGMRVIEPTTPEWVDEEIGVSVRNRSLAYVRLRA